MSITCQIIFEHLINNDKSSIIIYLTFNNVFAFNKQRHGHLPVYHCNILYSFYNEESYISTRKKRKPLINEICMYIDLRSSRRHLKKE